jgi:hypothetical protein
MEEMAAKDHKERKEKQHKLLSLCSLRSLAAKILSEWQDYQNRGCLKPSGQIGQSG